MASYSSLLRTMGAYLFGGRSIEDVSALEAGEVEKIIIILGSREMSDEEMASVASSWMRELKHSAKDLEGQLYEDLLFDYNKIPRPVKNSSDILTVDVGASLIRIIDVDEKNQVLTTNLWLEMKWFDAKLTWDPKKYGGLRTLHIPSDLIWTPDLVLYNKKPSTEDGYCVRLGTVYIDGICSLAKLSSTRMSEEVSLGLPRLIRRISLSVTRVAIQVLIDLMPPTSLVIPMFGRYLITTMILVALSTVVSVVTVNFRFRSGSAHEMSPWIRAVFLNFLPRVLFMSRPPKKEQFKPPPLTDPTSLIGRSYRENCKSVFRAQPTAPRLKLPEHPEYPRDKSSCQTIPNEDFDIPTQEGNSHITNPMKALNANISNYSAPRVVFRKSKKTKGRVDDAIFINLLQQVRFIAEHFQHNERESEISDDWTFVAMVLDRLFLLIFSVLNIGTMFIILEAPSLYDYSEAMNITVPSKPLGQANLFGSHFRSI
ncbi:hypothetical protein RB195_022029 [Necator americanus]|uniref:Neurotransmitter-gated ion-channel ligand binding domain protein n=1 Tax=Necator americanus TaxID=51031 RepID=A0ABR1EDN9_NECAM